MPQVVMTGVVAEAITGRYLVAADCESVCSFCGESRRQVKRLIAYIWGECVQMMSGIMREDSPHGRDG
jgi:ClpX C4-type zinc finger